MKRIIAALSLAAVMLCTSCSGTGKNTESNKGTVKNSNDSSYTGKDTNDDNVYVDVNEALEQINELSLNVQSDNYSYDDKPFNFMKTYTTLSDKYLYDFTTQANYRIDLKNGRVRGMCQEPGCAHDEDNSPGCLDHYNFVSPVATKNGLYYIEGSKVMLHTDDKDIEVYNNDFSTEYERNNFPDSKHSLAALSINNNKLYIIGGTFYIVYDIETGKASDPIVISDCSIWSFCTDGKNIYFNTENDELFSYDIATTEKIKIADKVTQCCLYESVLYYVQFEKGSPNLYSLSSPSVAPEKIIEDCYVNYCINDGYIYYQNYFDGRKVFICDIKGGNRQEIKLDFEEYDDDGNRIPYDAEKIFTFTAASHIDHVFITDRDKGLVFAFKTGSAEYATINLNGVI